MVTYNTEGLIHAKGYMKDPKSGALVSATIDRCDDSHFLLHREGSNEIDVLYDETVLKLINPSIDYTKVESCKHQGHFTNDPDYYSEFSSYDIVYKDGSKEHLHGTDEEFKECLVESEFKVTASLYNPDTLVLPETDMHYFNKFKNHLFYSSNREAELMSKYKPIQESVSNFMSGRFRKSYPDMDKTELINNYFKFANEYRTKQPELIEHLSIDSYLGEVFAETAFDYDMEHNHDNLQPLPENLFYETLNRKLEYMFYNRYDASIEKELLEWQKAAIENLTNYKRNVLKDFEPVPEYNFHRIAEHDQCEIFAGSFPSPMIYYNYFKGLTIDEIKANFDQQFDVDKIKANKINACVGSCEWRREGYVYNIALDICYLDPLDENKHFRYKPDFKLHDTCFFDKNGIDNDLLYEGRVICKDGHEQLSFQTGEGHQRSLFIPKDILKNGLYKSDNVNKYVNVSREEFLELPVEFLERPEGPANTFNVQFLESPEGPANRNELLFAKVKDEDNFIAFDKIANNLYVASYGNPDTGKQIGYLGIKKKDEVDEILNLFHEENKICCYKHPSDNFFDLHENVSSYNTGFDIAVPSNTEYAKDTTGYFGKNITSDEKFSLEVAADTCCHLFGQKGANDRVNVDSEADYAWSYERTLDAEDILNLIKPHRDDITDYYDFAKSIYESTNSTSALAKLAEESVFGAAYLQACFEDQDLASEETFYNTLNRRLDIMIRAQDITTIKEDTRSLDEIEGIKQELTKWKDSLQDVIHEYTEEHEQPFEDESDLSNTDEEDFDL